MRMGEFVRLLDVATDVERPYGFRAPFPRLTLCMDWEFYPPRNHELVAQLPITELRLFGAFQDAGRLLQLVWAQRLLQSLTIDADLRRDVSDIDGMSLSCMRKRTACPRLRNLYIRFSGSKSFAKFPPRQTLGKSVVNLQFHFDRVPTDADVSTFASLAACISDFAALESLDITDVLGGPGPCDLTCRGPLLALFLTNIGSRARFRTLNIRVLCYGTAIVTVPELFDRMLVEEVKDALGRLLGLVRFALKLESVRRESGGQDQERAGEDLVGELEAALLSPYGST